MTQRDPDPMTPGPGEDPMTTVAHAAPTRPAEGGSALSEAPSPTPSPLGPPAGVPDVALLTEALTHQGGVWLYFDHGASYLVAQDEEVTGHCAWRLADGEPTEPAERSFDENPDEAARELAAWMRDTWHSWRDSGKGVLSQVRTPTRDSGGDSGDVCLSGGACALRFVGACGRRCELREATPAPAALAPAGGALGDVLRRAAQRADDSANLDAFYGGQDDEAIADAATLRALADALAAVPVEVLPAWARYVAACAETNTHESGRAQLVPLAALLRRLAGEGAHA